MPEIIREGVTESGMRWTVERDTPAEAAARHPMTFAEFCALYPDPDWDEVAFRCKTRDPYLAGFLMHTRAPDGCGCFGPEWPGAQWCDPKDWHRLYYEARRANDPAGFATE